MDSEQTAATVEWLARLLYERDAEHLIRVGWEDEREGLRNSYREVAREGLRSAPCVQCRPAEADDPRGDA